MNDIVNLAAIYQSPFVTVHHGEYSATRIQAATHRAQQLVAALVDILDERAMLLSTSAQFTLALRDSHMMRAMMPISSKGYLRGIQIYHEQGRQSAALALCHEGLGRFDDTTSAAYDQLVAWKDKVESANSKRVDLISNLPLDVVVTHIVPRVMDDNAAVLGSSKACPYLYVSRTWRERFLLHPDGLDFMMEYTKPLSLAQGHDQLIRFAPFVKSLRVGHCKGTKHHKLSDLFSRANFRSLTHLEVSNAFASDRLAFLGALSSVAGTLTHFELKSSLSQTSPLPIVLHDLLHACPNLVSLVTKGIKADMSSTSNRQYPQMKHLSLFRLPGDSITYDAMRDLSSRFPSLVSLDVSPMPDSRLLPVIHHDCPLMQQLSFGCSSSRWDKATTTNHHHQQGLRKVAIGVGQSTCNQADIISMLVQHRHSLQSFRLDGEIVISSSHNDDVDVDMEPFTQLEELDFRDANNSCITLFLWIMQHAPYTTHLQLWYGANGHQHIIDAMIRLKHLRKVCIHQSHIEQTLLPEFIQHHIHLGNASSLEYLKIVYDDTPQHPKSLIPITRLQRLRSLEIFTHGIIPESFDILMHHVAHQCPSLEDLKLSSAMAEIAGSIFQPLRFHAGLKRLKVLCSDLSQGDMLFLTQFPKLEYFETWSDISNDVLASLQEKIDTIKFEA